MVPRQRRRAVVQRGLIDLLLHPRTSSRFPARFGFRVGGAATAGEATETSRTNRVKLLSTSLPRGGRVDVDQKTSTSAPFPGGILSGTVRS